MRCSIKKKKTMAIKMGYKTRVLAKKDTTSVTEYIALEAQSV
jgi:hypothetical protein